MSKDKSHMKEAKKEKKAKKPKIRSSAKAIILRDGKLLLQRCLFPGENEECYLFPGGGQKFGEPLSETLRREVLEEVGADVKVGRLVWIRDYISMNHEFNDEENVHQLEHYFLAELTSEPDSARVTHPDSVQVGTDWIELKNIADLNLYPKQIRTRFNSEEWVDGELYAGDVN